MQESQDPSSRQALLSSATDATVLEPAQRNGLTIAQLTISGLGMAFSLLAAVLLAILGLMSVFGARANPTGSEASFGIAWISLLMGLLAIPSVVYSIQRLLGKRPFLSQWKANSFILASLGLIVWLLALLLGNIISKQSSLNWLLLPPLQLLVIALPVWWIFELARRNISLGSRQRGWGLLNFGIFITTPFLMIIEIVVMLVLLILFAIWVSTNPAIQQNLQLLMERLSNLRGNPNPEAILPLIRPYLQNPLVIFSVLALLGGLIPLIEELFKPLAMWLLVGRRLSPAEGFVAGALSGAAFALVESLFYMSNPMGSSWAGLAIGRAGTCLLHITNTALVGWALADAWGNGKYVRLGAMYLLASALHGLWNSLSILTGLSPIISNPSGSLEFVPLIARAAPVGIVVLVVVLFVLLWAINLRLSHTQAPVKPALADSSQPF